MQNGPSVGIAPADGPFFLFILFQLKLSCIKLIVFPVFPNQVVMASAFNDFPVFQNHDGIRVMNRR